MPSLSSVWQAELYSAASAGWLPLALNLFLPFCFTFAFHRNPRVYLSWATAPVALATTGLTRILSESHDQNVCSETNDYHQEAQSSSGFPESAVGWDGYRSIVNIPFVGESPVAPRVCRLALVVLLLWVSGRMALFLGGPLVEWLSGFRARQTQCFGKIGSESTIYLGMVLRLLCASVCFVLVLLEPTMFALAEKMALSAGKLAEEDVSADDKEGVTRFLVFILSLVFVCTPAPFIDIIPNILQSKFLFPPSSLLVSRSTTDRSDFFFVTELIQLKVYDRIEATVSEAIQLKNMSSDFWEPVLKKQLLYGEDEREENDGDNSKSRHCDPSNENQSAKGIPDSGKTSPLPMFLKNMAYDICTDQDLALLVMSLQITFRAGWSQPVSQRRQALLTLRKIVSDNQEAIVTAASHDLARPRSETVFFECQLVIAHIESLLLGMDKWTRSDSIQSGQSIGFGSQYRRQRDPLGVVWIVGDSNFPFLHTLVPLAGALAAGNTAIVQIPSISASHGGKNAGNSGRLIASLLSEHLDRALVGVVGLGYDSTVACIESLLRITTGPKYENLGKFVFSSSFPDMQYITLEFMKHIEAKLYPTPCKVLSGQTKGVANPCYVDKDAQLNQAAKKIVWSRFLNAGQHSLAPDYVMCHEDVVAPFIEACKHWTLSFYGENPRKSKDYGRIGSTLQMRRLANIIDSAQEYALPEGDNGKIPNASLERRKKGNAPASAAMDKDVDDGKGNPEALEDDYDWSRTYKRHYCRVACGGTYDSSGFHDGDTENVENRYVAPTILVCSRDLPPLIAEQGAIMGPILIVCPVEHEQDAVDEIHDQQSKFGEPSAMYVFTKDCDAERRILSVTRSKGVTVNGTIWHAFMQDTVALNFDEFSCMKTVLRECTSIGPSHLLENTDKSASLIWNVFASIYNSLVDPSWPYPNCNKGDDTEQNVPSERFMSAAAKMLCRGSLS